MKDVLLGQYKAFVIFIVILVGFSSVTFALGDLKTSNERKEVKVDSKASSSSLGLVAEPDVHQSNPNLPATDKYTLCTKDEECWCKNFTGSEFIPGKTSSKCCLEEKDKKDFYCPYINRCAECIYQ